MTVDKADLLRDLLRDRPHTTRVIDAVLADWPDHAAYLLKSFQARSPGMLDATEAAAEAIAKLIAGAEARFASDYRWTCDKLRDEELFFHREGRYRLATFEAANSEVYSDTAYMARYVNGLLLTQVLWFNHVATFQMFLERALGEATAPFNYLEVGPGHGLMVAFAARSPLCRSLEAWDVSEASLAATREALDRLGVDKPVALTLTDILAAAKPERRYDLIVISEVLEHLEQPGRALAFLRGALAPGGRIFVNVPLNSPSPDHIYLLGAPEEVTALVEGSGLRVDAMELFATQGSKIERALANRISVSAGVLATAA